MEEDMFQSHYKNNPCSLEEKTSNVVENKNN